MDDLLGEVTPLSALHRKLSRKIAAGKAMQLTPEELDWLVVSGAYSTLLEAVASEAFSAACERLKAKGYELSPNLQSRGHLRSQARPELDRESPCP